MACNNRGQRLQRQHLQPDVLPLGGGTFDASSQVDAATMENCTRSTTEAAPCGLCRAVIGAAAPLGGEAMGGGSPGWPTYRFVL